MWIRSLNFHLLTERTAKKRCTSVTWCMWSQSCLRVESTHRSGWVNIFRQSGGSGLDTPALWWQTKSTEVHVSESLAYVEHPTFNGFYSTLTRFFFVAFVTFMTFLYFYANFFYIYAPRCLTDASLPDAEESVYNTTCKELDAVFVCLERSIQRREKCQVRWTRSQGSWTDYSTSDRQARTYKNCTRPEVI